MKRHSPIILPLVLALVGLSGGGSQAAAVTWDGGGDDDDWDTVYNWDNNELPGSTADVIFGTAFTSGTSINLIAARTVNSFTINTATGFSITGGDTLTLSSGQFTRNDVDGTEGNHSLTADITLGANGVFNINGDGITTISGEIGDGTDTFSLTKSGNGILVLAGANASYKGDTIVSGGVLRLGDGNHLPDGAGNGNLVAQPSHRKDKKWAGADI